MKICLINNLYQPYQRGGAENIATLISRGLIQAGHQVIIITSKPFFSKNYSNQANQEKIYYLTGCYYQLNKLPVFFRLFWHLIDMFDLGIAWRVKSILKSEQPQLVITHNLKGLSYLIPQVIKSLKIKHCHYLHDIQLIHPSGLMLCGQEEKIRSLGARAYARLCRFLFASPEIVVSPSQWLLDFHEARGFFPQSRKIVLPNPAVKSAISQTSKKNNNNFRFLFVGQIEGHKGIIFLLEAFQQLARAAKQKTELIIIGDGVKMPAVKKITGAASNIKLLGRKKLAEVCEQMATADCLVVPSLCYENSPSVIYQAWQVGLPVIAAKIGGIPELVNNKNMLFEPNNAVELREKMFWVMANQAELKKISRLGLSKAAEYNLDNYLKKLLAIIA